MKPRSRRRGGEEPPRQVTSIGVAEAAQVSQSTVSLVLSGKAAGRVSAKTQALVQETARRLGYQPNVSAQTLRTGAARTLALAVPNVQQPFFGQLLVAAELRAREHDYAVLLVDTTTDLNWAARLVGLMRSRLVAGCIVYASDDRSEPALMPVKGSMLFIEANDPKRSGVDLDIGGAMTLVVEHLAALGHKRIGYFAAEYPKSTFGRRFEGFLAALTRLKLSFEPNWRISSTFELEGATLRAKTFLQNTNTTALFCDDDLLAGAVYRAARQIGITIPAQLSVVGFNDVEIARLLSPELTTVSIPVDTIGQTAVDRLLLKLQGKSEDRGRPFIADLQLRVRASTAAPKC